MSVQAVAANNLIRSPQLPGSTVPAGCTGGHNLVTGFDLCFTDVLAFSCMVWYLWGGEEGEIKRPKTMALVRTFFMWYFWHRSS